MLLKKNESLFLETFFFCILTLFLLKQLSTGIGIILAKFSCKSFADKI